MTDSTPLFDWDQPTEGEPIKYRLKVVKINDSLDNGPFALDQILTGSPPQDEFQTTQALVDALYKWIVVVEDARSTVEESAIRNFTLDATPPQAPDLQKPVGGVEIRDNTPEFVWSLSADPLFTDNVTYTLQVAAGTDTGDFSTLSFSRAGIVDQNLSTPNFIQFTIPDTDKLDAAPYVWRVRAVDSAGNTGDFSTPETFVLLRAVNLALQAVPEVLLFGGEVKVSINVQPQEGLAVDQVKAFLDFNPTAMEVVGPIVPGSTFTNVTSNTFDNDFGTIDFAASGDPTSGDFVLAEITFKTKKPALAELLTSVDFVETGSRTTDALFSGDSVLGDLAPAAVTILKPSLDVWLDDQVVVGELVDGKLLGEVRDFFDNLIPNYRGLASGEVVQVTISVRQDSNQRVEALDVFLDFNPADLELLSLAPPDNAKLPVVLKNEKDNVKGTAVFSAQVSAGSPPA